MFPTKNWLNCHTNGNGSCAYHSFAEVFVRIIRNHPEFINPTLFAENNPVFKPLQDFFKYSLKLSEPLSLATLQNIFSNPANQFNSDFICKNVAPGVLLLFLSHYRHATAKIKPAYERIYAQALAADGWSATLDDICFDRAVTELGFTNQITSAQATDIEKEYYLDSLKMSVTGREEIEHEIINILSTGYPFINEFLSNQQSSLSSIQAKSFINLIERGFTPREYADQGLLLNLAHILFRPSVIARDRYGHPDLRFPCAFGSQEQLNDIDWVSQPYAVYRCAGIAHFEYAISRAEIRDFKEQPSRFSWSISHSSPIDFPGRRASQPAHSVMPTQRSYQRHKAIQLIEDLKNTSHALVAQSSVRKDMSFSFFDFESLLSIPSVTSICSVTAGLPIYLTYKLIAIVLDNPISTLLTIFGGSVIIQASENLYNYYLHSSPGNIYPERQRKNFRQRANVTSLRVQRPLQESHSLILMPNRKKSPQELTAEIVSQVAAEQTSKALRFFAKSRAITARPDFK